MKMHTSRIFPGCIALLGLVTATVGLWGQGARPSRNRIPLAEDWSNRHLIFSSPKSAQQEYQLKQQYRYWQQWFRRNARVQMSAADKAAFQFAQPQGQEDGMPGAPSQQQRPWAIYGVRLLLAALFLLALALSMKETRRRRLAFVTALGLVAAFLAVQIGCGFAGNSSAPQPVTTRSLQRDWSSPLTAGASVGETMFPAKFTFDITAAPSCTNDFVVFTTGLAGTGTTADIVAYNQLYSGAGGICGAGGPSVLWAYQTTSAAGRTVTSPVLSIDGTQVTYVEGTGGTGVLHILRPTTGGTPTAPATPTSVTNVAATYVTCKATPANSCLLNLSFSSGDDSFSAPFYDYGSDVLFVGDNSGSLHKFTGVFNGTPAEAGAPWPVTVNSTHPLTGPVKDDTSGNVYVNDVDGTLWYVREAGSLVGTCGVGTPPCLGSTSVVLSNFAPLPPPHQNITDPPIVDSAQGRVFAFTGHSSAFTLAGPFRGANVYQADTALSSFIQLDLGVGDSWTLHSGDFDNAYVTSVATGHLYVCANSGPNDNSGGTGSGSGADADNHPTLKRITFNSSGTMNAVDAGTLTLTTATSACSPVTEILNGATDWTFMSVQANGTSCSGNGCVVSVSVPTGLPFTFPSAVSAALPEPGGASGIVVDNVSAAGQASSIYFTILANSTNSLTCNGTSGVGCAVKATQSGLQ